MSRYVFDPEIIHQCALKAVGKPKPEMFDVFANAMDVYYPGVLDRGQPWVYSIAGGAMIQMKLYYASLEEYVMIWGTPIGSGGHTGRHLCGFWDTVLDGETWYYAEGQFERTVYRPGDRIYVGPGEVRGMNFTTGVWAVEYARGPIPTSIPFGLADVLISCNDWLTAAQTVSLYADLVCQSFAQRVESVPLGALAPVASGLRGIAGLARKLTYFLQPPPADPSIPRDNRPWRFGAYSPDGTVVHPSREGAHEFHTETTGEQPFQHKGSHPLA